jgi:hypothetical protein
MVHWPKSVAGYVLELMLAVIVVGGVVQLAILLSSHLLVLAFLVVVALTTGALIVWHRRAAAAHDLAVACAADRCSSVARIDLRHPDLHELRNESGR